MNQPRDRVRILANTREMLDMARAGLADATGTDPRRRRSGVMNLFTYGRSVTLVMQTMKSVDPAFEEWWRPHQEWMAGDQLMRCFNRSRNEILKEGELRMTTHSVMGKQGPVDMGALAAELQRDAPPNTVGWFLGDSVGGHGWEVRLPDGSIEKVYFDLPPEVADNFEYEFLLSDPPDEHDGRPIENKSIANLGGLYIAALSGMVDDFVERFRD